MYFVSETAQVELKSGRVYAPADSPSKSPSRSPSSSSSPALIPGNPGEPPCRAFHEYCCQRDSSISIFEVLSGITSEE